MASVVLVHSPFLGPSSWQPVAQILTAQGHSVVVPDLTQVWFEEPAWVPRIAATVGAGGAGYRPVTLVGHSGAGPLLPAIAATLATAPSSIVYVDAGLPAPGRSWRETAPADLVEPLTAQATDGLLPTWDEWFVPETVESLVPDDEQRRRLRFGLPRVPLAYLEEAMTTDAWAGPSAYLLLSGGYRAEAYDAGLQGWPVEDLASDHLALVTRPVEVAEAVLRLADRAAESG
jgi:pimeloyl-ACP methyl ester carboxylesterase